MTFPQYVLPPEVHDHLAELLDGGGFDFVKPDTDFMYPPGITGPDLEADTTYKAFVVGDGKSELFIGSSYHEKSRCYLGCFGITKGSFWMKGSRYGGRTLYLRVEQLLLENGVVKR